MKTVVIIPCRWDSSRFPGKPLARILGRPLIQYVYENASSSKEASRVVVATDDQRIEKAVKTFGGDVVVTSSSVRTGSDRAAELIEALKADVYVNLQGDELIQNVTIIDELIRSFSAVPSLEMGTLKRKLINPKEVLDPNVVKVITDKNGFALYFSRSPIPFMRDDTGRTGRVPRQQEISESKESGSDCSISAYYKHLGIYIFERETLRLFASLPTGCLEFSEKLEQLRALENGIKIKVWETQQESFRIDTKSDLQYAERQLSR